MSAELETARRLLHAAQRVLVVSHIRPDGDAIGSLLGLGLTLEAAGKQVHMVISDGVPAAFRFLQSSDKIRTQLEELTFDLIAVVDVSEVKRAGAALDGLPQPHLNFDHHITNTCFAQVNLVESDAVATSELLARRLPEMGLSLPEAACEAFLTGILTDTIGFRTLNMTPRALRVAADLVERGADLPKLYQRALLTRSFQAARFWGFGLSRLEREGGLVWATLTGEDRKLAGYSGRDDADLTNILSSISDAEIAVVFVEQPDGNVKISWRATGDCDVSRLAQQFGGGGHRAAAGAMLPGPLVDAKARVIQATRELL